MLPTFLTGAYPLEKQLFLVPRSALKLLGFYPETQPTLLLKLWALFNFFVLSYGCYAEFYYGVYYLKVDIMEALDALCPVASSIVSWVKLCCIWWYRDELKMLIQRVRELTSHENLLEKTELKIRYLITAAIRIVFVATFFGGLTSTAYTIKPLLLNLIRYFNGSPFLFELPFKMIVPDVLVRMPIYPLTFLVSHWFGYTTIACLTAGDGFFVAFCFYFSMLLKALSFDLNLTLKDPGAKGRKNDNNEEEIVSKLVNIIERHNEIIELTARFSKVMVVITLGHFVSSSIITCTGVIGFLLSMEVATTAYCTDWCTKSIKIQKMVNLIIIRAQRALVVKVPFFAPSLVVLTSILNFTGSLIA